MPYSASDKESLPANVQEMSKADREQWVAVWNNTYAACIDDGGKKDTCEGRAFSVANGVIKKKKEQSIMSQLQKLWQQVRSVFAAAGVPMEQPSQTRIIAGTQLSNAVRERLEEMNAGAYKMDPQSGGMYMDWDEYYSPMDIYYDTDGSLFVLTQRAGKLYRIPIAVSEDGEEVTLAEPAEIPLMGRTGGGTVRVYEGKDGVKRWFAIAGSAVLNRVNEIDSTILFDNFIRRANEQGKYPALSFYHEKNVIHLGQADWLGRSEYLYLAAGTFADTPDGQAALRTLEQQRAGEEEWGNSIGYEPIGEPELLEVARGIRVPVYTDGFNSEISIVRERDAAAYFTRMSTEEVKRAMSPREYDAMVAMFGEQRAKELAEMVDGTNRAIVQADAVRRDAPAAVAQPAAPAASEAVATAEEEEDKPAVVEIPEELFTALSEAFAARMQPALDELAEATKALLPRVEELESLARSLKDQTDARLQALEQDEEAKHREWVADLPKPKTTSVIVRPREVRSQGQDAAPSMADIAAQTLANMRTRMPASPGK